MILAVTELVLTDLEQPALDATRAYELYGRFLWQTLFRLGVREADLPDALQDVLVVVHRRGRRVERGPGETSWLFAVCRRIAAGRRRKAYARREIPTDDFELVDPDNPERLMSTRRARLRLERILDALSDEQRIVFVMFEVEGLSCPEIAAELAVPVGTVYSRLHAARQSFQKSLGRLNSIERRNRPAHEHETQVHETQVHETKVTHD